MAESLKLSAHSTSTDANRSEHQQAKLEAHSVHRRRGPSSDAIPLRHELILDLPVGLMLSLRVPLGQHCIHLINEQHTRGQLAGKREDGTHVAHTIAQPLGGNCAGVNGQEAGAAFCGCCSGQQSLACAWRTKQQHSPAGPAATHRQA